MAKTRQKVRRVGPPMKKRAPRAPKVETVEAAPTVEVPEAAVTKDGILEAMAKLCDEVDAQLAEEVLPGGKERQERAFSYSYNAPPVWKKFEDRKNTLRSELRKAMWDDKEGDLSYDTLLETSLTVTPGIVPSWARPGVWLEWVDFIPFLCQWGGYIEQASADFWACDLGPWPAASGHRKMHPRVIERKWMTPRDLFRQGLAQWTTELAKQGYSKAELKKQPKPIFQPQALDAEGRESVQLLLTVHDRWLPAALRRGPVDQIPMPAHVRSIQMALA